MSDLLYNMSVPPKSLVDYNLVQLDTYILFNPNILKELLEKEGYIDTLDISVKKYYNEHLNKINKKEKPNNYMLGKNINLDEDKEIIESIIENYSYETCYDIELLIIIFCSTINDIYIPNRNPSFETTRFNNILLFNKSEVLNE